MKKTTILASFAILFLANACNDQDYKASILKANDELFNKGNAAYADQVFAADYAGEGSAVIKKFANELITAFPDLQVKIDPIIVEGDKVAWMRTHTGTHRGSYQGFPASGKKLTWTDLVISQYADGKVTKEWGAGNLLQVLQKESVGDASAVTAVAQNAVDALNKRETEAYLAYLHPQFTQFLSNSLDLGAKAEPKTMDEAFASGMNFNLKLENLQVAFYGTTAIVTGYEAGDAVFSDGTKMTGKRKYTSVWVNEDGVWKTVHLHISSVVD